MAQRDKNRRINGGLIAKVAVSLLLMAVIVLALGWAAFSWMDIWTLHGHQEVVPDVKGLSYNDAVTRLTDAGLVIELSDSLYDNATRPGTVLDQNPKGNTKVKPGRVVYVTINAFSPKTVTLPQLTDVSLRQARSMLEGIGIKNVKVVEVMSEYKDLVLGVKCDGRKVLPGARVSVKSTITLEVGDGLPELHGVPDSVDIDRSTDGTADEFELLNLE